MCFPLLYGQFMSVSPEAYAFTYLPVNFSVDERHITRMVQGIFNRLMALSTKASKEPALSELI